MLGDDRVGEGSRGLDARSAEHFVADVEAGWIRMTDLRAVAAALSGTQPSEAELAAQLREHDDRQQFLAGVDIFLKGIAS